MTGLDIASGLCCASGVFALLAGVYVVALFASQYRGPVATASVSAVVRASAPPPPPAPPRVARPVREPRLAPKPHPAEPRPRTWRDRWL